MNNMRYRFYSSFAFTQLSRLRVNGCRTYSETDGRNAALQPRRQSLDHGPNRLRVEWLATDGLMCGTALVRGLPNRSALMIVVASRTCSTLRHAARRPLAHIGAGARLCPVLCKAGISIDTCGAVHEAPPLSGLAPLVVIYASQLHDGCSIRRILPGQ